MIHMMFSGKNCCNMARNNKLRLPNANIHKDVSPRSEIGMAKV